MEQLQPLLSVFSFLVEIVVLAVVAVWTLSRVNVTTTQLTAGVNSLVATVTKLEAVIARLDEKLDHHETRLVRLETKLGQRIESEI